MLASAIILAVVLQAAPPAPPASGSLTGCAADITQQRLPRVSVLAKSGRVQRTTTADGSGCYELNDLPAGSYRVTVRLTGFDNVTRDGVIVAANRPARLDVVMGPTAICECIQLDGNTLAKQWGHADAVLHVRLSAPQSQPVPPAGYYHHAATVIDVLKTPAASLETPVVVLQNQRSGAPDPYDSGQEVVLFLRSGGSTGFVITNDALGLAVAFLVQDGRVQRAPPDFSRYVGMPLNAFLDELRALARRK